MAAAAIMDFAESEFLQQNRLWGSYSPFAKFHANISHIVREIAFKPIFKIAAAAILDFLRSEIWRWNYFLDVVSSLFAKFCANMFNNNRVVAVKKNFKMAAAAILDFVKIKFRW